MKTILAMMMAWCWVGLVWGQLWTNKPGGTNAPGDPDPIWNHAPALGIKQADIDSWNRNVGTNGTTAISRISVTDTGRWTTAWGWGNHAVEGYLKGDATQTLATVAAQAANGETAFGWGDHSTNDYLTPVATQTLATAVSQAGTAFGWGDHSTNDYLKPVATQTLATAASEAFTAFGWGDHGTNGYLTPDSTQDLASVDYVAGAIGLATQTLADVTGDAVNGQTAFEWGNHALVGYLTVESDPVVSALTIAFNGNSGTLSSNLSFSSPAVDLSQWAAERAVTNITMTRSNAFDIGSATCPVRAVYVGTNTGVHFVGTDGSSALTLQHGGAYINGSPVSDMVARASASSVASGLSTETVNRQTTDRNVSLLAVRHARLANQTEYDLADGIGTVFKVAGDGLDLGRTTGAGWFTNKYYNGEYGTFASDGAFSAGGGNTSYGSNAAAGVTFSGDWSMAFWVLFNVVNVQQNVFSDVAGGTPDWQGINMDLYGGQIRIGSAPNTSGMTWKNTGYYPNASAWHHYALVQTNSSAYLTLFIDGERAYGSTTALPAAPANNFFCVGAYKAVDGSYLANTINGRIDDFGYWNRALTGAEIASLAAGNAIDSGSTDLGMLLTFDATPDDSSPNASKGALVGAATYGASALGSIMYSNMTLTLTNYTAVAAPALFVGTAFLSGAGYAPTQYYMKATANDWTNEVLLSNVSAVEYQAGEYIVTATGAVVNAGITVSAKLITTNNANIQCKSLNIQTDQ